MPLKKFQIIQLSLDGLALCPNFGVCFVCGTISSRYTLTSLCRVWARKIHFTHVAQHPEELYSSDSCSVWTRATYTWMCRIEYRPAGQSTSHRCERTWALPSNGLAAFGYITGFVFNNWPCLTTVTPPSADRETGLVYIISILILALGMQLLCPQVRIRERSSILYLGMATEILNYHTVW